MANSYFQKPDLQPIDKAVLKKIIDELFPSLIISKAEKAIETARKDWNRWSPEQKLIFCDKFYAILYSDYFPKPIFQTTFNKHNALGFFNCGGWKICFSIGFISQGVHKLEEFIACFLHENFHAFLFFLSICVNPAVGYESLRPPESIMQFARKIQIDSSQNTLVKIAKKNFLGTIDRNLGRLDSYFLNVEILTDNLAEILFSRIFPSKVYSRGYSTEEQYINKRMNGCSPDEAKRL